MPTIGVYLENSTVQYDLRRFQKNTLIVDADLGDISDDVVRDFLIHMAAPRPFFGFACTQEELEYRNRITVKFGINIMESWVGRDTRRYIPGLYWWTLLPASLAEQHGSLSLCERHRSISSWKDNNTYCASTRVRRIGDLRPSWGNCTTRVPGYLTSRSCGQNFKE